MSFPDLLPIALWGAAGSYPDMPSRRMAYDADQTVIYVHASMAGHDGSDPGLGGLPSNAVLTEATTQQRQDANDPTNDSALSVSIDPVNSGGAFWFMFFPEGRELDGYYVNSDNSALGVGAHNFGYSTNTTNGVDGTWSSIGSEVVTDVIVSPDYRNNIQTSVISNAVAVSLNSWASTGAFGRSINFRAIHIYGTITPGNTPDRLLFLDTLNSDVEFSKPLDYGNIGRGTTTIRTIKLKNNSGSLQANTVQITSEDLIGGTPSGWFTFSTDGINDQGTLNLGNIAAGGTSTVYVHLQVPDAAAIGLYQPRIAVSQASWS